MLCLISPATTGNTGQENQGGWLQRASTGKKRFQFARKLVATEDFRARQTDKGRLESQDGYRSGWGSFWRQVKLTHEVIKGQVFQGPILDSPFQSRPELSNRNIL